MDRISISKREWEEGEEGVTFLIDGRDLIDMIQGSGGRADILLVRSICYAREDTVFREHSRLLDERLVVLACVCGSPHCTSITVRIQRLETMVIWSDFAPAWLGAATGFPEVGPFTFARDDYEEMLQMGRGFCRRFEARG